jgi:predicted phosphodiesterase
VTRWGILADVHGNLPALERALAELRRRNVERIAVLGDNLGRGDSDGCVELIRVAAEVSVVGNRDLDWKDRVGPLAAEYVLGLPRVATVGNLAFSHGDARLTRELSSGEIRGGFRRAGVWLLANRCRVWFFGHSHQARVWTLPGSESEPLLHVDAATDPLPATVGLGADAALCVVNVGSVGLPFPRKGPASATVYDESAGQVELFPV